MSRKLPPPSSVASVFAGPGEMRARCRAFDWMSTALGPIEGWSASLRVMAGTVLSTPHPMFLWWGPELVQLYNDGFRATLDERGRHPQALGTSAREYWAEAWHAIGPKVERVMRAGESLAETDEYRPVDVDGRVSDAWSTYSWCPVRDDDGSVGGTLGVRAETTQQVLAERAARAVAEASARACEEVLGIVAHDLGNPLAAIDMAASALVKDVVSPELPLRVRVTLATVLNGVRLMNRLIRDLTDVANIEVGQFTVELHEVPVGDVLEATAAIFAASAREGGVTLIVRVPPDLPVMRADPDRLVQALANLVANALKYSDAGGRITLSAEQDPAGIRLTVQDTGPGIGTDELPHVFDRYWQKRRSGGKPGGGLGLAIVRGIAEAHGGTTNVRSAPGAGSEFSFTIPSAR